MTQHIPLVADPSQQLLTVLGGQSVQVNVYQKDFGLFIDLLLGKTPIITGVICEDRNFLVRYAYLGFSGDLSFIDTLGTEDPIYSGLGSRFQLWYFAASELPAGVT